MLKIKYFKLFFFVVVLALLTSSGVLAYEIQYPDFSDKGCFTNNMKVELNISYRGDDKTR